MEQNTFNEVVKKIDVDFILANREIVTDFFGDRRNWYEKLVRGGSTFNKTSLDSQNEYDIDLSDEQKDDEPDLSPLEPNRITEERAKSISVFFEEYPEAKKMFLESNR